MKTISKIGDCGSDLSIDNLEGGTTAYSSIPERQKNDQRSSLRLVKVSSYKRNHNGVMKNPFQNQTYFVPKLLERSCSRGNFKSINFHSAISKNIEKNGYEFYKNKDMQNKRSRSLVQRTPSPDVSSYVYVRKIIGIRVISLCFVCCPSLEVILLFWKGKPCGT